MFSRWAIPSVSGLFVTCLSIVHPVVPLTESENEEMATFEAFVATATRIDPELIVIDDDTIVVADPDMPPVAGVHVSCATAIAMAYPVTDTSIR